MLLVQNKDSIIMFYWRDSGHPALGHYDDDFFCFQVSGSDYICHTCWQLINRDNLDDPALNLTSPQPLGHQNVCVGCGRSILRFRSRFIVRPDMSDRETMIANIFSVWISPRLVSHNTISYTELLLR